MKIQVNRNSWHGRLTRYVYGDNHIKYTPSFCPYFWSIWLACFVAPFQFTLHHLRRLYIDRSIALALVLIILGLGIVFAPGERIILISLIVVGASAFGILMLWIIEWYEEKYPYVYTEGNYTSPEEKESSVISVWLHAKKDKVCPRMEEVDN